MILLTRPIASSIEDASFLASLKIDNFIEPLMNIKPLQFIIAEHKFDLLVATSKHSIEIFSSYADKNTPIAVPGESSAAIAKKFGFMNVLSANNNAISLVEFIKNHFNKNTNILVLRGEDIHLNVKECLNEIGYSACELVVYKAILAKNFSDKLIHLLQSNTIKSVALYSRRTAQIFLELMRAHELKTDGLIFYVLSDNIASILLDACISPNKIKIGYLHEIL